ncbi:DUF1134 domain-containing protein [Rhodomicrobium lacus]|uniref:DUF1134 domain-containing protein n=1 Tax=Rhodomicrobium lacus TaxID=2498452 RepID=UPI0026E2A69A|nr:DUF1134 domain-containing protein [Rhodomicrobium lacus]WKW51698.1 DUF1134 domain-containing protein [Rhodomicrobium lacus]
MQPDFIMTRHRRISLLAYATVALLGLAVAHAIRAEAQDYLPPQQYQGEPPRSLRPPQSQQQTTATQAQPNASVQQGGAYAGQGGGSAAPAQGSAYTAQNSYVPPSNDNPGYGQPYSAPPQQPTAQWGERVDGPGGPPPSERATYSSGEILDAGHRFFGSVSEGLAKVVEHAFQRYGRPTGYILGEDAGGAIVAGLRYGEGTLHTKMYPTQKVYWQGPSIGYDFGAAGSKTLTLVYNLTYPAQIFERFAGVDGSAYLVGGVGITFQQHDDVILAPIRAGVGLRLGANVGYLKYTPSPTWNPF